MLTASGLIPVEGTALSYIRPKEGFATHLQVFDDFLVWNGFPTGALTVLSGSLANNLARKIISLNNQSRCLWMHTFQSRPHFYESSLCHRWQTPDESAFFEILHEQLNQNSFDYFILNMNQPLAKNKMRELMSLAQQLKKVVIVLTRKLEHFSLDFCDLYLDCQHEYIVVRKAIGRPIPFWIPTEMIEIPLGNQDETVLDFTYETGSLCG